ncbi:type I-U CRISPR-associated helicase/endonuclease Cas3 [Nocardia sp. CNY236]|uniref:type I-G CRISPR-associated helicase/endonuclease Cas3g n=1 Tax=Nocardia sp. CNY236 TaxID=1169152 RepID=UPI0004211DDE|nr:type I-U CRISPR-associated helicase/endonuclease Cas3 [Nocardia sp. CNY236]
MGFPTFAEFHEALYGTEPFPWQQALADRVVAEGWPDTIDIPTGLGKTRTITVAVWHLAAQIADGGARTAPLRVLHVVDRTTIVDQTHHDLQNLHEALHRTYDGPVARVASVLREAFGTPLVITKLHGGAAGNQEWVAVDKPTVVTMTAHQAVSRALFRGFGVSPAMAPVHAALLGMDSLILLDEPHLSVAALSTLRAMKEHQQGHELGVPTGKTVQIGATVPPLEGGTVHRITDTDRAHTAASTRLEAPKTLALHPCSGTDKAVTDTVVRVARIALAGTEGSVAVVVNTVDTARWVHAALTSGRSPAAPENGSLLVISRIRKHERKHQDGRLTSHMMPRLLVATQTVEAGIDFSVPTLVTEICDWQALTQRLGRLNRHGEFDSATAHVVIPEKPRPGTKAVYGEKPATALAALLTNLGEGTDLSPRALTDITTMQANAVQHATRPAPPTPTLIGELLPTIAHSRPVPAADLAVQRYITGIPDTERITDVTVLWRNTLDPELARWMPPDPDETVTVPLAAVNALIANRTPRGKPRVSVIADDGESALDTAPSTWFVHRTQPPPALVFDGKAWVGVYSHRNIAPGATVILPSSIGGHDATGFHPASTTPVSDLSAILRWQSGRWWHADSNSLPTLGIDVEGIDLDELTELCGRNPDEIDELLPQLLPEHQLGPVQYGPVTDTGVWLRAPVDERDEHLVTLGDHAAQVATETDTAAKRVGLASDTTALLVNAAYHHDDGKLEPMFQAALGAEPDDPPLAKLAPGATFRRHLIPPGWRHESASLARNHQEANPLVRHVIAAHHGWARPLLPAAEGPDQALPTANDFALLNQRYGVWGLAWLETVVRLADHRASRHPEKGHTPSDYVCTHATPRIDAVNNHSPIELTGIPVDSALAWWATAGALAAATDLDPHAAITYTPGLVGPIATIHTTTALDSIANQTTVIVSELGAYHDRLAIKNEKPSADWVRTTLAGIDTTGPARQILASLLNDTATADEKGKTPLRTVWIHNNSTLIGAVVKASHTTEQITDVLTRQTPHQYDGGHHFGMTPQSGTTMIISGIPEKNIRSPLQSLLFAATARLPATGGARPAGQTYTGRMHLPLPQRQTSWIELIALLQTLSADKRPWRSVSVDHLPYQRTALDHAKSHAWELAEETT